MSFKIFFLCLTVSVACAACSNSLTAASVPAATTPAACTGTCTLTGQVVQQGTSNGIASASLMLVDGSGVATTSTAGATGAFSFPNLPAGTYSIQASAPGYVTSAAIFAMPVATFTVALTPVNAQGTPTVLAVFVSGNANLKPGQTSQLTATVQFTDGTTRDVTNVAKWSSNVTSVATVSVTGLLTAYTTGSADITASFQTYPGTLVVTVSP